MSKQSQFKFRDPLDKGKKDKKNRPGVPDKKSAEKGAARKGAAHKDAADRSGKAVKGSAVKNKKTAKQAGKKGEQPEAALRQAWISMRSGVIVIAIVSIGMSVWVATQVYQTRALTESILWGLIFGGSIWIIFFGFILFNRFLRRGS